MSNRDIGAIQLGGVDVGAIQSAVTADTTSELSSGSFALTGSTLDTLYNVGQHLFSVCNIVLQFLMGPLHLYT